MGRRMELALAPLSIMYDRVHSAKPEDVNPYQYMPHEDEPFLSAEEAMEIWGD